MLTDTKIRAAKAADKGYRLLDGDGLHLFVTPAAGKSWRFRYEVDGRERIMVLGHYPDISLAEARRQRDEARAVLKIGKDPVAEKKRSAAISSGRSAETFEIIAREWHEIQKPKWVGQHAKNVIESLEKDIFPDLGAVPIRDITASSVLDALWKVETRGAGETARRIRQRMSEVFVFAIASGRAELDPAAIIQKAMAPIRNC